MYDPSLYGGLTRLRNLEGPIAYAVSNGVDPETNYSSCTLYDILGNQEVVQMSLGEVEDCLTSLNGKSFYYIRVGKQYVINADCIVYISPMGKVLTLAFDNKEMAHLEIKGIPENALRKLHKEMKRMQEEHASPFYDKVCFCTDSNGYWFYPQEVLYVISDGKTKSSFLKFANGMVYYIPARVGDADEQLNGFPYKRKPGDRTSKFCIIQLNKLDHEHSTSKTLYIHDAMGNSIPVADYTFDDVDEYIQEIKLFGHTAGSTCYEIKLSEKICKKYYNYISSVPRMSYQPRQRGSFSNPFFNFETNRSSSSSTLHIAESRDNSPLRLEFGLEDEED